MLWNVLQSHTAKLLIKSRTVADNPIQPHSGTNIHLKAPIAFYGRRPIFVSFFVTLRAMNDTDFINQFESAVAMAVKTGDMPAPGACVVAALSGGADSVALTVTLHRLGYRVTAVHCNYHLRGEESNRDARSAEDLCRRLTIPLRSFDFDVEARRKSTGESIEMACRELRYDVFARVLSETDSEAVAVGHHREDNIETFFINLLRGSGLRGLTGMRPWDTVRRVMRPLLGLTRGDIERYLNTLGVEWVNDSSNASNDYRRTKLRNVVMPALRSMFPDCEERISASLALLGANRTLYDSMCGELSGRFVSEKGIDVKAVKEVYRVSNKSINESPAETFAETSNVAEMVLYELLQPEGFNMTQCRDILRSSAESGRMFRPRGGTEWLLDRGYLRRKSELSEQLEQSEQSELSDGQKNPIAPIDSIHPHPMAEIIEGSLKVTGNDPTVIYLSEEVLSAGKLSFRHWRAGDRIKPFGMKGSRKVSDVLSDAKVARDDKARVRLLVLTAPDGEETILWVCGLRTSRHFRVPDGASRYVMIRYDAQRI